MDVLPGESPVPDGLDGRQARSELQIDGSELLTSG